jgi:hypothetical protein
MVARLQGHDAERKGSLLLEDVTLQRSEDRDSEHLSVCDSDL